MSELPTLRDEWQRFSARMLDPIRAGHVQRTETRHAWYAGAAAMFTLLHDAIASDDEPDDAGAASVQRLYLELEQWSRELQAEGV